MTHPATREFLQSAARQPAFQSLLQPLTRGERGPFSVSGLVNTAKALYIVLLYQATEKPLFVLVDGNKQAETLLESVEVFFHLLFEGRDLPAPQLIPALDVLPHQRLSPHNEIEESARRRLVATFRSKNSDHHRARRIGAPAHRIRRISTANWPSPCAPAKRFPSKIWCSISKASATSAASRLKWSANIPFAAASSMSFRPKRRAPCASSFLAMKSNPFGQFDVESQRSVLKITAATLLPLAEYPRSRSLLRQLAEAADKSDLDLSNPGEIFPGWEFLVPLVRPRSQNLLSLSPDAIVVLDEPHAIASAADRLWQRLENPDRPAPIEPAKNFLAWEEWNDVLKDRTAVSFRNWNCSLGAIAKQHFHIPTRPSLTFQGNMPVAVAEARNLIQAGNRVAFFAPSAGEIERLADRAAGICCALSTRSRIHRRCAAPPLPSALITPAPSRSAFLIKGRVRRGAVLLDSQLAILGSEDLFETSDLIARQPTKSQLAAFAADIADLKPGDFVVHATHGVGQFLGIRELTQGDQKGDFMLHRVRRRIEVLRSARAPRSGPEISRRGRSQACISTALAASPGKKRNRASKPKCATWRTSS